MKKLLIASDHAAFNEKENLKKSLQKKGYEIIDLGPETDARCDYPDFAVKLSQEVLKTGHEGVLLCGSGIGMSIAANRFKGIRAALVRTVLDAELARAHNNANVLCLGGRISTNEDIFAMVEAWIKATFEGGRHSERVNKLDR